MFTWMYSKASSLFATSGTIKNNKQTETNRKLCSTNFCLQAIKAPVITSAAEKKMEIKTSNSSWLTTQMRNIYNFLPNITLTGSGFAINGLNFDLRNVPKNLKNNLIFLVSLFLVAKTQADSGDFYFMDPTNSSDYKLYIREGCFHISAYQLATNIMNACNATSQLPPYLSQMDLLYDYEALCVGSLHNRAQLFYRAVNNTIHNIFESCIVNNMSHPSHDDGSWKNALIIMPVIFGVIGVGILSFACFRGFEYIKGYVPFYLCDSQKAQHKKHGERLIEKDDVANKRTINIWPINSETMSPTLHG